MAKHWRGQPGVPDVIEPFGVYCITRTPNGRIHVGPTPPVGEAIGSLFVPLSVAIHTAHAIAELDPDSITDDVLVELHSTAWTRHPAYPGTTE